MDTLSPEILQHILSHLKPPQILNFCLTDKYYYSYFDFFLEVCKIDKLYITDNKNVTKIIKRSNDKELIYFHTILNGNVKEFKKYDSNFINSLDVCKVFNLLTPLKFVNIWYLEGLEHILSKEFILFYAVYTTVIMYSNFNIFKYFTDHFNGGVIMRPNMHYLCRDFRVFKAICDDEIKTNIFIDLRVKVMINQAVETERIKYFIKKFKPSKSDISSILKIYHKCIRHNLKKFMIDYIKTR